MPYQSKVVHSEAGEQLAIDILTFLGNEPEALERFLATTGLSPATLRRAASDRSFLAGVLDFLLGDEPLLLRYAEIAGIDPATIAVARRTFSTDGA